MSQKRIALNAYFLVAVTIALLMGMAALFGPDVSSFVWRRFRYDPLSLLMVAAPLLAVLCLLAAIILKRPLLIAYFRILFLIAAFPITIWFLIGFMRS